MGRGPFDLDLVEIEKSRLDELETEKRVWKKKYYDLLNERTTGETREDMHGK